jgi:hypothetical protein
MKALAASFLGTTQMELGEACALCGVIVGMFFTLAFLAFQFNLLAHQLL